MIVLGLIFRGKVLTRLALQFISTKASFRDDLFYALIFSRYCLPICVKKSTLKRLSFLKINQIKAKLNM